MHPQTQAFSSIRMVIKVLHAWKDQVEADLKFPLQAEGQKEAIKG